MTAETRDLVIVISCALSIVGWACLIGERVIKLFQRNKAVMQYMGHVAYPTVFDDPNAVQRPRANDAQWRGILTNLVAKYTPSDLESRYSHELVDLKLKLLNKDTSRDVLIHKARWFWAALIAKEKVAGDFEIIGGDPSRTEYTGAELEFLEEVAILLYHEAADEKHD